jgi:hypothetical protein
MTFGYDDSQTLRHLTFFCGDFLQKEPTPIGHKTWTALNIINRPLPALTNKLFEKSQKKTIRRVNACLQEGGGK